MTPNPGPMRPPTKKSSSKGCLIAVGVVFGLFGLSCLVGSFFLWRAASTEEGKKIVSAIGKGAQIGIKGMNAPGSAEVRAAGCPQAIILATKDIMDIVHIFKDGGERDGPDADTTFVLCQGKIFDSLPECDEVARAYSDAVHPTADFVVSVNQQGKNKPLCSGRYAANGLYLGDFGGKN